jgi:hypothetical protein
MPCLRFLLLCGFVLVFIAVFHFRALAAFTFQVASVSPVSIDSREQEIQVTLNFSGLPSASYFRVAFQKEGSDSYVGYLKNDRDEWTKVLTLGTSDCANYYSVPDVSSTSATLYIKIGEDQKIEAGTYVIKAHRYTSSCKTYSTSQEVELHKVILHIPTPIPSPTITPTYTPAPTQQPTNTPTPVPTMRPSIYRTNAPTPAPTIRYASAILGVEQIATGEAEVHREDVETTESGKIADTKPRLVLFALLVMSVGMGLLSFGLAMKKVEIWKAIVEKHIRHPGK